MYVLVRTDGKYVAPPGQEHSYTSKLEDARIFPTRDAAEKERCVENETVRPVSELLHKPG
jgi:hypothetical protein